MEPVAFVDLFAGGFLIGCVSGLTPGLHVNSLAFLLVGFAAGIDSVGATGIGLVLVAAAFTHLSRRHP